MWETSEKEASKDTENVVEEENWDCGINISELQKGLNYCKEKRDDLNKNLGQ